MMDHLEAAGDSGASGVDCANDPVASLLEMFVAMVQGGRIKRGQCPALRPVFLKPHGIAHGVFRVRPDLPADLKVGLLAGAEYPAWVRFSSDTLPTLGDFKTTLGIGIKLFRTPTPKVFGSPQDTTFDIILQNFDVFFVDTAADMCAFTKAGVVDGDYGPYLAAHPDTAKLLDEMAKPVASTLATAYWSCVPFAFGSGRFVKYKLEPTLDIVPIADPPSDPTYLAADLQARLKAGEARFRFAVQFSSDPVAMPLDKATVRWEESVSPPIHVADLVLHQQDIAARGQEEYGENLAWNIWRVTKEHEPQGSIAAARRSVYAAAAEQRRNVNGIPTGEPAEPKPALDPAPCVDTVIVRAAIHPAIGVARIGDSQNEFLIGPEVAEPAPQPPEFYRDAAGALKRQAARFRIYGYNAGGEVVRELTPDSADIRWTVHLANKKAQWYQFQAALDIPDAATLSVPRRNAAVPSASRGQLAIDPGPRSISGTSVSGGKDHLFDTGTFKGTVVPLGEIRTDSAGRLLVLGGTGKSASPSGAPVFNPADPNSFNNADDWYDDISDGPVSATVSINGQPVAVEAAWVAVAPPNYAPNIIGWRTLHDLLIEVYVQSGWMKLPQEVSFAKDILPLVRRLSNLQWVNKGFATMFGKGGPMDFDNDAFIAKLKQTPHPVTRSDPYAELRQVIFNSFHPSRPKVSQPPTWPRQWPWIYGDAFGSFAPDAPDNNLALTSVQESLLRRWVNGDFIDDWPTGSAPATALDQVSLAEQPAMLDRAALHFCLADAFHPGCEVTWPIRHATMYDKPFRIRHRGQPEADYGKSLNQQIALQPDGPLYAQGPGDLTRWMALPWQGDTAFCRSGYDLEYDPYVPTFWAARVPNQVLTEEDYQTVINTGLPRAGRLAAFNHRPDWLRAILQPPAPIADIMMRMIAHFGALGLVEARPGIQNDPDFPEVIFVESLVGSRLKAAAMQISGFLAAPPRPLTRFEVAGWADEQQYEDFRSIRVRNR
jgi:hypothetical protein